MLDDASWVTLSSAELSAKIDPLGAQLSALRDREGRDLLWSGDPTVWRGRAPLLFPIVGALAGGSYRLGSMSYALSRHGFARDEPFERIQSTEDAAVFRLRANERTLPRYPYQFELDVQYQLSGSMLSVTALIRNDGDAHMPASFGYHPAFRWPLPYSAAREAHVVEFQAEESAPIRRLDSAGLLTPVRHRTPVAGRYLALDDALFRDDVVIFDQLQSRSVVYGARGTARIRVSFPDTPYFGIWTKPGAGFICLEPWHGIADPAGFRGDFLQKPGIFLVPAGGSVPMVMTLELLAP